MVNQDAVTAGDANGAEDSGDDNHEQLIVLEEAEVPGWARVKTDVVEGYVMLSFLQKTEQE